GVPGDADVDLLVEGARANEDGGSWRNRVRRVLDRAPGAVLRAVGRIGPGGSDPERGPFGRAGGAVRYRPRHERRRHGGDDRGDHDERGSIHLARLTWRS